MASGKARHQEYLEALQRLGRELSRRARSSCELSSVGGRLVPYDLEGPDVEPVLDHVILVAPAVAAALDASTLPGKSDAYRYLEHVVWSGERAIRRAAVRLLERIDEPWARDAIDNARQMDAADDGD